MFLKRRITRDDLLRKLDIPNFQHMTVDKVLTLANNLPYMDREVALQALSEFPNFVELEKSLVVTMRDTVDAAFTANDKSTSAVYDSCKQSLDYCYNRLNSDNITDDERIRLENMIMDVNTMIYNKDTENKQFIASVITKVSATAFGIAVLAFGLLGGAAQEELPFDDD